MIQFVVVIQYEVTVFWQNNSPLPLYTFKTKRLDSGGNHRKIKTKYLLFAEPFILFQEMSMLIICILSIGLELACNWG